MPYSTRSRGSKDTEMALDDAMRHGLNLVDLANSTFCSGFSEEERGFWGRRRIGALLRPPWLQSLEAGQGL